jgi:hypothetical protein
MGRAVVNVTENRKTTNSESLNDRGVMLVRAREHTPVVRPDRPSVPLRERRLPEPAEHQERTAYRVPISSLRPGESPRLQGTDREHVTRLAELETPLPPILVDRRSMRVIDGMHRLLAAVVRGCDTIEVEFFDGPPEDAFLKAVQYNVTHGTPLTQADRRAAAARIIETHPHMSDRSIAECAGLGAKSVAALRRCLTDAVPQLNARRLGRDGRLRPLSTADGRRRAAELMSEAPTASLREVAAKSGISLATVSDVRKRIARGLSPVPDGSAEPADAAAPPAEAPAALVDPAPLLNKLLSDPALRYSEDGRRLLQVMRHNSVLDGDWVRLLDAVPAHGENTVAHLARYFAQQWAAFAKEVEGRTHIEAPAPAPSRRGA